MVDLPSLRGGTPADAPGPGDGCPDGGEQGLLDGNADMAEGQMDPGLGSGSGNADQVEEAMELPLGPLPPVLEDEISTDISDPENWSGADTPPPLVPKVVIGGKRPAGDLGARPRDQKTLKRKVEKRSHEPELQTDDSGPKERKRSMWRAAMQRC